MRRGTGRIVFFCGGFVVKFCRIQSLLNILKDGWRAIYKRENRKLFPSAIHIKWKLFLRGIRQNRTEHNCWKLTHAPFLVPIHFGLSIANVQKREWGEEPTEDEVDAMIRAVAEKTKRQIYCIDPHCLEPKNFLKTGKGLRIVDYGDASDGSLTFPQFIIRWQSELASVLCR